MQYFNIYGPINELGYGAFVRGLIRGLYENNINHFFLSPIGNIDVENKEESALYVRQSREFMWRREFPAVAVWHEFDLGKFSSNKLVAFPIFETTRFIPQALNYLSQMDAVFVMSSWAKKVVEDCVPTVPVFVVPGAANLIENDEVTKVEKNNSAFTFLYIGKYEQRKSPLETIGAYLKAFQSFKADTRLVMHCYNPFDPNFVKNMSNVLAACGLQVLPSMSTSSIIASKGNCIIEVPWGRIPAIQVSQLYRHAHIGVFPSRAEGWNLPLMEGIQSGLPCIATNYSAHTEYLTEEFGYNKNLLLNNLTMSPAKDGVWFHGDRGDWAIISVDELAEKMLYSYTHYEEIVKEFDNTKIKETFTWKNTASKFLEALEKV